MNGDPDSFGELLDETALERVDRVCIAFEEDWKRGEPPHIESYVSGVEGDKRVALLYHLIRVDLVCTF